MIQAVGGVWGVFRRMGLLGLWLGIVACLVAPVACQAQESVRLVVWGLESGDETKDQDVGIGTHIFISILKLGWYCPMTMNLNYPIPTVQHQNQFRPDTDKNGVHVISFTWLIVPEDHISFFRNKPKGFASH